MRQRRPPKGGKQITYNLVYEERAAANFAGYTWEEYCSLAGAAWWAGEGQDNKAMVVATYQVHCRIESLRWSPDGT